MFFITPASFMSYRMLHDIVDAGEILSKEVVQQHIVLARRWFHSNELRWMNEIAFIAEDYFLSFATIRWCSNWIEGSTSIRFTEIAVSK
jgi:hypothetical protein